MYKYNAKATRVIDGDTFEAEIDLGFNIKVSETFRLKGIDTPESYRPSCEAEKIHGKRVTELVIDRILDKDIIINTYKTGKYGRYICDVTYYDEYEKKICSLSEQLFKCGCNKLTLEEYQSIEIKCENDNDLDKLSKRLSDILGDNKYLAELIIISDVIFNYENIHYPII